MVNWNRYDPNNIELEKNIKFIKLKQSKKNNYKILYGGSVNPNNIKELNMINNIRWIFNWWSISKFKKIY